MDGWMDGALYVCGMKVLLCFFFISALVGCEFYVIDFASATLDGRTDDGWEERNRLPFLKDNGERTDGRHCLNLCVWEGILSGHLKALEDIFYAGLVARIACLSLRGRQTWAVHHQRVLVPSLFFSVGRTENNIADDNNHRPGSSES